jgi:hypothetical protein
MVQDFMDVSMRGNIMPNTLKLGPHNGRLYINFHHTIHNLPLDIQLSPCARLYLETNGWLYVEGDGCGVKENPITLFILKIANAIWNVDYTPICNIHDLEYGLDMIRDETATCIKTYRHRATADVNLYHNMYTFAVDKGMVNYRASRIAYLYHAAVSVFGGLSYWRGVKKKDRV